MSLPAMKWALDLDLPAMRKMVLMVIASMFNDTPSGEDDKSTPAYPKQGTLAKKAGMSRRSVCQIVKELEEAGLIMVRNTLNPGGGDASCDYVPLYPGVDLSAVRWRPSGVQELHTPVRSTRTPPVQELHTHKKRELKRETEKVASSLRSEAPREEADLFAEGGEVVEVSTAPAFEDLWSKYPHKTAKVAAQRAYAAARKAGVSHETMTKGLDQYVATKPPDRPWLNLATFINQRRWEDAPAPVYRNHLDRERAKLRQEIEDAGYGSAGNQSLDHQPAGRLLAGPRW